jgi:hypothetical protein
MPKAGWCLVAAGDRDAGLRKARVEWHKDGGGEGHDPWVQVALAGAQPFAGHDAVDAQFVALAEAMFAALPGAEPKRTAAAVATEAADD